MKALYEVMAYRKVGSVDFIAHSYCLRALCPVGSELIFIVRNANNKMIVSSHRVPRLATIKLVIHSHQRLTVVERSLSCYS